MIESHFNEYLMQHTSTFIKPADSVAVLMEDHNVSHAKLLLSQYKYSRVPVINKEKQYVGVLGLNEIVEFEMASDFFYEKSQHTAISEIVNQEVETVQTNATLEEILHKLIKESFLPVLKDKIFTGIIARQEVLKAINAMVHDFGKDYEITKRNS